MECQVAVAILFFTVCSSLPVEVRISQVPVLNDRPIIGVALQETPPNTTYGDTYVSATYIKYLQQAGARVVPVRAGETVEHYTDLFFKLNGLLFPGGGVSLTTSLYARTGRIFYNLTLQAAEKGDMFPLWGTCLGFQLLNTITAGKNLLQDTDSNNITLPLDFVPGFQSSRMFVDAPEEIIQILRKEPVTQNEHTYGMLTNVFNGNSKLKNFYHVLSTNVGKTGKAFISTFEAFKYPIYGTQWHPEKNAFNWNIHYNINHSAHAVKAAQYFANFFVGEARKSSHRFPEVEEEVAALIDNYNPVFAADDTFYDMYFFNLTEAARKKAVHGYM